jgi:hypothetical protein
MGTKPAIRQYTDDCESAWLERQRPLQRFLVPCVLFAGSAFGSAKSFERLLQPAHPLSDGDARLYMILAVSLLGVALYMLRQGLRTVYVRKYSHELAPVSLRLRILVAVLSISWGGLSIWSTFEELRTEPHPNSVMLWFGAFGLAVIGVGVWFLLRQKSMQTTPDAAKVRAYFEHKDAFEGRLKGSTKEELGLVPWVVDSFLFSKDTRWFATLTLFLVAGLVPWPGDSAWILRGVAVALHYGLILSGIKKALLAAAKPLATIVGLGVLYALYLGVSALPVSAAIVIGAIIIALALRR